LVLTGTAETAGNGVAAGACTISVTAAISGGAGLTGGTASPVRAAGRAGFSDVSRGFSCGDAAAMAAGRGVASTDSDCLADGWNLGCGVVAAVVPVALENEWAG